MSLIQAEHKRLAQARVFTSDQWGDYLIYHGWPRAEGVHRRPQRLLRTVARRRVPAADGGPAGLGEPLSASMTFSVALIPRDVAPGGAARPAIRPGGASAQTGWRSYTSASQTPAARPNQIARLGRY